MNGFTFRYAIRMPNGQLFAPPQPDQPSEAQREQQRRYMLMLGMHVIETDPEPAPDTGPVIFDRREDAETLFHNLRENARQFGVDNWGGMIVAQLCTPFTPGDPGLEFIDQITHWIDQEGIEL